MSTPAEPKVRIFLSYGRADAEELAERLDADLALLGFDVWRDRRKIRTGREWDDQIEAGRRSCQLVVAVLTPHAVREESVCRDELAFARFARKLPIVPALAKPCEPPFVIFRLDYIDLTAWRKSADRYKNGFKRLVDSIQAHLRGEPPRLRRWDDRLPQFDFGPYLHDKRRDFRGREWLFRSIDDWRADPGRQRALLITGDPGIGKSAIVAQLVHLNPGGQVLAYHCCRADVPETLRPARFIPALAGMIASQLKPYAARLDDQRVEAALGAARCETDPASAFEEGILDPLHTVPVPAGGSRYILIDALDEALATRDGMSLITLLAPARLGRLPGWLRIVATTRREPDVLRRLSGLRAVEIRADEPDNLVDVERFLAHRLTQPRLQARLRASGVAADDAARRLREQSAGNFLWAEQVLDGLEDGTYDFARLDALPPGLTGLYTAFFERHFPDAAAYAPVRQVLEVVTAAGEPLTVAEIAAATGLDPDYDLPAPLDRLAAYLPERDGRRSVYHKSLADWLTDPANPRPAGRFFVSPRRGHERLADWCWADSRRGADRLPPYALRHLPAHLAAAGRFDNLATLLLDLPFLEAKAEAGQIFELAADFTRAIEAIPPNHPAARHLRLIRQALRADVHFLARHPTELFQCLWNRAWWYDSPEAAAHYDPPRGGWPAGGPPWSVQAAERIATLLESWHRAKSTRTPSFRWLRSHRPPPFPLGGAELACLRGHENSVLSVAFASDGRRLASGSDDRTVRVWDADTGAELACLRGHQGGVESVAFARDGRRLASGSRDETVRIWDADTGAELACLRGHESIVQSVAFARDDRRLASGSFDRTVRVWDADTGAELACLRGHEKPVASVAFAPDGHRLASGSWDKTVRVWDAAGGAGLACLRGHEKFVHRVEFELYGGQLVSGSWDGTARIWDAASGVCLGVFPDTGNHAATATDRGGILWRAIRRNLEIVIEPASGGDPVAWFPAKLRSISYDSSGRIWAGSYGSHLYIIRLEGEPDQAVEPGKPWP